MSVIWWLLNDLMANRTLAMPETKGFPHQNYPNVPLFLD